MPAAISQVSGIVMNDALLEDILQAAAPHNNQVKACLTPALSFQKTNVDVVLSFTRKQMTIKAALHKPMLQASR